jgi:predicted Zn-dependent peptidase/outer membrane lipoprotein-sorting protein
MHAKDPIAMNARAISARIASALCTIALLAALTGAAARAQIDITKPPAPGPAPTVAMPVPHVETLPNGLKVFIVTNATQPVVMFRLLVKSGAETDPRDKAGIATFTASLLTKGTATRSALEFATQADSRGISIEASAADDYSTLTASGLKRHMTAMLDLMSDALLHPGFAQEELEKDRTQVISGIVSGRKSPSDISNNLEITIGFNAHPYSQFLTEAGVKAITREDLVAHHARTWIPNNATLAIVGDVTPKEILPLLAKYFGGWKRAALPAPSYPAQAPLSGTSAHLVDLGSSQTQTTLSVLVTGIPRSHPDWMPLLLANSVIGGGMSGRLFQNLREKRGFTYGAYSNPDGRCMGGVWTASADVRREATDSAVTEILHEMKRLGSEPVPEAELTMHKQYNAGTFLLSLENPQTTASYVQFADLYKLPADYYATFVTRLMAVTAGDIQRVARAYFGGGNVAITAVGDAAAIKPQLERFAPVTMYDVDIRKLDASAAPAKADIDAETLLARHIAATGGAAAMTAVTDRTMEADVALAMGPNSLKGGMIEIRKAPNKVYSRMSIDFQGQAMVQESWNDGASVVQSNPMQGGNTSLSGADLAREIEKAQFNDILRIRELGYTAAVTAKKQFDGKPVYVLEIKKGLGNTVLLISAETWLVVAMESQEEMAGQTQTVTTRYADYRAVDGVQLPWSIIMDAGMTTMTVKVTSYKQNTGVKDEQFTVK